MFPPTLTFNKDGSYTDGPAKLIYLYVLKELLANKYPIEMIS